VVGLVWLLTALVYLDLTITINYLLSFAYQPIYSKHDSIPKILELTSKVSLSPT